MVTKPPDEIFLLDRNTPYLVLVPFRGQRTKPSFVRHTATCIATQCGETREAITEHCSRATLRFFPKLHAKIASL